MQMKRVDEAGFTILETMLFLAITALMMMSIIIGSNTSINRQRYYDSVNTLKSIIQQQYSNTENTIHDTSTQFACNSTTGSITDSGTTKISGQSDCVLLGKFIITPDPKTLDIYDVVGTIPTGSTLGLDDVKIFIKDNGASLPKGYGTYISTDKISYTVDWGASLGDSTATRFSMAILRSPLSGNIVTFINTAVSPASPASINYIVNSTYLTTAKICVNSNDLLSTNRMMAIGIAKGATNASGVSVIGEDASGCH